MQIKRLLLCTISALVLPICTAYAECQLKLVVNNVEWRGGPGAGYHIFDDAEYTQTVDFKVEHKGDACSFFVTFSRGWASDFNRRMGSGGEAPGYQLYKSANKSNVLKDLPSASATEVISGTFEQGDETRELRYVVVIPPLQIRPAGIYRDRVRVIVYEGTLENFIEKDSKNVTISARVHRVAELSLVNSGEPFNPQSTTKVLDFGPLTGGKSRSFDLRVRSNSGYTVTFESENGGAMKNTDPTDNSTVAYVLEVDGAVVDLSRGRRPSVARNSGMTDSNGERRGLSFAAGPVGDATAGTYRDNITITVAAGQ
jgi:spore coat protein U-like protein